MRTALKHALLRLPFPLLYCTVRRSPHLVMSRREALEPLVQEANQGKISNFSTPVRTDQTPTKPRIVAMTKGNEPTKTHLDCFLNQHMEHARRHPLSLQISSTTYTSARLHLPTFPAPAPRMHRVVRGCSCSGKRAFYTHKHIHNHKHITSCSIARLICHGHTRRKRN